MTDPEGNFRYPERLMYVTWKPAPASTPRSIPGEWGLTVGDPWYVLLEIFGIVPVRKLDTKECIWSGWLSIPQACDRSHACVLAPRVSTPSCRCKQQA